MLEAEKLRQPGPDPEFPSEAEIEEEKAAEVTKAPTLDPTKPPPTVPAKESPPELDRVGEAALEQERVAAT